MSNTMYPRSISARIVAALADTPVVILHGARQVGKTTLVRRLAESVHPAPYLTFDNPTTLAAAKGDPEGFVAETEGPVILDEVQRVPEVLLPIKAAVDRDRRPGRFLLTGSAQVLQIPKLADSLAGRMEVLTLWPLSKGELLSVREGFVDALFAGRLPTLSGGTAWDKPIKKRDLAAGILAGGYPEAVARENIERRRSWFESYVSSIMTRDVREISNIAGLADLPRLMRAVAGRAGGLLNYAELGRDLGLNQMTTRRYLTLLETTFLVRTLEPWFSNRLKRLVKSPKVYVGDSGLLGYLLDLRPTVFTEEPKTAGMLLENFVALELWKQTSWSRTRPTLWHFRDHRGNEVDFVLEAPGGSKLVGVEVKSGATLDTKDFSGLRMLAQAAGNRFHRGVVLYTGSEAVPFGKNLHALPLPWLWELASRPAT